MSLRNIPSRRCFHSDGDSSQGMDEGTNQDDANCVKNDCQFKCPYCSSLILQRGMSKQETTKFSLPHVHQKMENVSESEIITKCWLVQDMFHFENVGFSNTVGKFKYLTCADCEMGPIGWHNLDTKLNYIADQRVKHE